MNHVGDLLADGPRPISLSAWLPAQPPRNLPLQRTNTGEILERLVDGKPSVPHQLRLPRPPIHRPLTTHLPAVNIKSANGPRKRRTAPWRRGCRPRARPGRSASPCSSPSHTATRHGLAAAAASNRGSGSCRARSPISRDARPRSS